MLRRLPTYALLLALGACASGPTEDETAQIEDYLIRGSTYFQSQRYEQAYDQARRALELDQDDPRLNLLAGRSLLMQRQLQQVAMSYGYLEKAYEDLDSYKAAYSLAEFHFRYGSMLLDFASRELLDLQNFPEADPAFQEAKLEENRIREETAFEHFEDAKKLLLQVNKEVPEDLDTLEMLGQVCSLLDQDGEALEFLNDGLAILGASREYKNFVLGTDSELSVEEEGRLRRDLAGDIDREVAVRFLLAGLLKRAEDLVGEEAEYSRILALKPGETSAHYSRGMVRYELGRLSEAAFDMRAFLRHTTLDKESAQVAQAVEVIAEYETLRGTGRPATATGG